MKALSYILAVLFVTVETACSTAQNMPPSLSFYAHAESLPPNTKGDRYDITFFPDGLIHTYQISNSNGVLESFSIERRDNVIMPVYNVKDSESFTLVEKLTVQSDDTIVLSITGMKKTDVLKVVRKTARDSKSALFEELLNSNPDLSFRFSSQQNEIDLLGQNAKYLYTVIPSSGLPRVQSTGSDSNYTYQNTSQRRTVIYYRSKAGMPLWTYTVEGETTHSTDIVAILNYELIANFMIGVPIFPYIGGMPTR